MRTDCLLSWDSYKGHQSGIIHKVDRLTCGCNMMVITDTHMSRVFNLKYNRITDIEK